MQEIIKKFRFRGEEGTILHAPADLEKAFAKAGLKTVLKKQQMNANVVVFVSDRSALLSFLQNALKQIEPDSVFWIAYPKGTSKIKTDINRDIIREAAEQYGVKTVTAISIDETWSALRFRPLDKVGQ